MTTEREDDNEPAARPTAPSDTPTETSDVPGAPDTTDPDQPEAPDDSDTDAQAAAPTRSGSPQPTGIDSDESSGI